MTWTKLTPNLMVDDMRQTLDFYQNILGFELAATVPDKPPYNWVMLGRDEVQIMFQTRESLGEEIPALESTPLGGALSLYVRVRDIDALYERVQGNAKIVLGMRDAFYGMREFALQDPNGFVLMFAQPKG